MGSQQHSTTSKTAPWVPQQQYLTKGFQKASDWLGSGGASYYPGQQVAPFTQAQQQGQAATTNYAQNGATQQANNAAGTENYLTHAALDPTNNPNFQHAASAAVAPIYQNLNRNTLPQQDSQAIAHGAYGGARNGIMQSNAMNDANQEAGNVTAQMANHAYDSGLNAATKGLAMAPQTQQMGSVPGQLMNQVGAQQQQQNQTNINANMNRYAYNQQQPLNTLQQYSNLIQGNYGGTNTKPYFTNPGASALGGAASGAAMGSAFGPIGMGVGGGIGALMGFL